jgi:hypothetical protein
LGDPVSIAGIYFADLACAKRFPRDSVVETAADKAALARCLAQYTLQVAARKSSLPSGAVLAVDPGIELELGFEGTKLSWIGFVGRESRPTLTAQAFEALRTAGSKNLDAVIKTRHPELARVDYPISAWVTICVDADGTVATRPSAFRTW